MTTKAKLFTAEWFPYYYERFEGSDKVAVMSLTEEGAYHRAIRIAWKYGSVPANPEVLASKIQKRCTAKVAEVVLTTFDPMPDNPARMIHSIVEEIREEQRLKHMVKVKGGKAAAKARKQTASSTSPAEVSSAEAQPQQIKNQIQNEIDFKRLIERVASENSDIDVRLVEIGVLHTFFQRNGDDAPIRSTKYFAPEVKHIAKEAKGDARKKIPAMSDGAIESMLQVRRRQFYEQQGWKI